MKARLRGFTLLELLAATAILLIVMVVLLQLVGGVGDVWKASTGKISAFQNARSAFATVSRTLSRATLNTYNDYIDAAGNYRTSANAATFSPAKFARASELHFLSGPAATLVPGANATSNPGGAVFFQAPMGDTDDPELNRLNRTLNSTGFYIQYGDPDSALVPNWLQPLFAGTKKFRLVQLVEPTEKLEIYNSTAAGGYPAKPGGSNWLDSFRTPQSDPNKPRARVLAEDVCLLVLRPRLAPKDEEAVAGSLGASFDETTQGSILSPNYHYDSRAWMTDYPGGRVATGGGSLKRSDLMRNQVPPIVDVAMVSVDRRSLARLDQSTSTPPTELQVPSGLFTDSSRFEDDLATYSQQLSDAKIRHRVFRTSVEIQGAKWSNN